MTNHFACPCCGYFGLSAPAYEDLPNPPFGDLGLPPYVGRFGFASFQCCACCGYEFGFDCDAGASGRARSFEDYRVQWIKDGARWFSGTLLAPKDWNLTAQLMTAGICIQPMGCDKNP